jgi:hypothetical protein
MKITRREALKLGLAGTGTFLSPFTFSENARAAQETICSKESLPSTAPILKLSPAIERFEQPLYVPKPLNPVLQKTYKIVRRGITINQPIDYYDITMRKQKVEILPAKDGKSAIATEAWIYQKTGDTEKPRLVGPPAQSRLS